MSADVDDADSSGERLDRVKARRTSASFWSAEAPDEDARLPRRVVLLRHGETDWNVQRRAQGHADIALNERGREQAQCVSKRLASWDFDVLYSSTLSRAAATAKVVGAALGIDVRSHEGLREVHIGRWSGLIWDEIVERFPEDLERMRAGEAPAGRGGETFDEFHGRVRGTFEEIARRHVGESVLVVTHGGVVKSLVGMLLGMPASHFGRLSSGGNTGITVIDFRDGLPYLRQFNDTTHLDGS